MNKKICFAIFAILLFALPALAQPYIVADPQADADKFRIRFSTDNGVTWGAWAEGPPVDGGLKFSIAGVAPASYKGEAQAGATVELTDSTTGVTTTVEAWSDSAPFLLTVRPGNAPAKIKVLK